MGQLQGAKGSQAVPLAVAPVRVHLYIVYGFCGAFFLGGTCQSLLEWQCVPSLYMTFCNMSDC